MSEQSYTLEQRWSLGSTARILTGNQAIALVMLAQAAIDRGRNLRTAGYVSGYRGSPLGSLDSTLQSIAKRLEASNILFQPGVNEDLAASAVRGTQQLAAVPDPKYDGVFAAWYGKGPGVDRSGDAFKHGNYAGVHPNGGVALFYGDDHLGKSSTVAHQSEQAIAASLIPSLYPANVQELFDYGLFAFALSRYSGAWIGVKCVTDVVEQTATVTVEIQGRRPVAAPLDAHVGSMHIGGNTYNPLEEERVALERRLPLVQQFVRANNIDRVIFRATRPRLGIVTAGKTYGDVLAAMSRLGIDRERAEAMGLSLYKVGCIWPLEPGGLSEFARGHAVLFVIEEKKAFLEQQAAAILFNERERPLLIGKSDEQGKSLLSSTQGLDPVRVAIAIADRMMCLGEATQDIERKAAALRTILAGSEPVVVPRRAPYFCSGCPHNRSTRVPAGSMSMTGIGCHTIANFVRPAEALLPGQMGGEGANWIGLAPFTNTKHIFQNMGDGTYFHSGLLAIRAAVAAGVNITYKILYNDAVAMTGGQAVDGPISVALIARQVLDEGVKRVAVVTDNPAHYARHSQLPDGVTVHHRDELDGVQRTFREVAGCTALIYEQTCAAEKRRRRKRQLYPDPPKRLFIAHAICEGCGDCSAQSTCVSILPRETAFGRKRQIDQASCNKDFSCNNGFCPSFLTIYDAEPRGRRSAALDSAAIEAVPEPAIASVENSPYNILLAGIGGTGVITVSALLATAAHIDGLAVSALDQTGLAQKNGAVTSHVRIASSAAALGAQRISIQEADLLVAFDALAALGPDTFTLLSPTRTYAVVNKKIVPTAAFQFDGGAVVESESTIAALQQRVAQMCCPLDAVGIATVALGDSMGTNLIMLGVAAQLGRLPVSVGSIERAIQLNEVAVESNLLAFRLGRQYVTEPERVASLLSGEQATQVQDLNGTIAQRARHLEEYQDEKLAERYLRLVERVRATERRLAPRSSVLTTAVARAYAKLLAYKDEYEVARLLTSPSLRAELRDVFGTKARIAFNLAPPLLRGRDAGVRSRKIELGRWFYPVLWALRHLKGLRGTYFDPFSYTRERATERLLIKEYEALLEEILPLVNIDNLETACDLAAAAEEIRGFGPVKEESIARYRNQLQSLRSRLLAKKVSEPDAREFVETRL